MARNLYEAFVEREVVSDGVLPPLLVVAIVRKVLQKESIIELIKMARFYFSAQS